MSMSVMKCIVNTGKNLILKYLYEVERNFISYDYIQIYCDIFHLPLFAASLTLSNIVFVIGLQSFNTR